MFGQFVKFLVSKCLLLLEEFRDTHLRSYRIDEFTIRVNLDASLRLPFPNATVEKRPQGKGWIEVKRVAERLLVGGAEIIPKIVERKRGEVQTEMTESGGVHVHPNVLDALAEEYPDLVPERLKFDERGRTLYTFCRAAIFRGEYDMYVRYFCWDEDRLDARYLRLEEERGDYLLSAWGEGNPSFQLASKS